MARLPRSTRIQPVLSDRQDPELSHPNGGDELNHADKVIGENQRLPERLSRLGQPQSGLRRPSSNGGRTWFGLQFQKEYQGESF